MNAESNTSMNHKYSTTQALTNPLSECPAPQNTMFAYLSIETLKSGESRKLGAELLLLNLRAKAAENCYCYYLLGL